MVNNELTSKAKEQIPAAGQASMPNDKTVTLKIELKIY